MSDNKAIAGGALVATYAESQEQLRHTLHLIASLRQFGGRLADSHVLVCLQGEAASDPSLTANVEELGARVREVHSPDVSRFYFYGAKPCAAAIAEKVAAESGVELLVWLDDDTIILDEPVEFLLPQEIALAYRPVMHNRSGSLYGEPTDAYWARIYELLQLDDSELFPMTTPADHQRIRAYFNAGVLVTRPENQIMESWARDFHLLARDSLLKKKCHEEINRNIFLHQAALVGAILNKLDQNQLLELSDRYNYPIFFDQMYGADAIFENLGEVVTLRYDAYFRDPDPDWSEKLQGPANKIAWLKARLGARVNVSS